MGNFDEWQLHQNDLQTNNPAVHPSQADTRRQVQRERPIHVTGLTGFVGGQLVRDELVLFTGRKSPWERHNMKEAWDDMKEDFLQKGGELKDAVHEFVRKQFITQNDGFTELAKEYFPDHLKDADLKIVDKLTMEAPSKNEADVFEAVSTDEGFDSMFKCSQKQVSSYIFKYRELVESAYLRTASCHHHDMDGIMSLSANTAFGVLTRIKEHAEYCTPQQEVWRKLPLVAVIGDNSGIHQPLVALFHTECPHVAMLNEDEPGHSASSEQKKANKRTYKEVCERCVQLYQKTVRPGTGNNLLESAKMHQNDTTFTTKLRNYTKGTAMSARAHGASTSPALVIITARSGTLKAVDALRHLAAFVGNPRCVLWWVPEKVALRWLEIDTDTLFKSVLQTISANGVEAFPRQEFVYTAFAGAKQSTEQYIVIVVRSCHCAAIKQLLATANKQLLAKKTPLVPPPPPPPPPIKGSDVAKNLACKTQRRTAARTRAETDLIEKKLLIITTTADVLADFSTSAMCKSAKCLAKCFLCVPCDVDPIAVQEKIQEPRFTTCKEVNVEAAGDKVAREQALVVAGDNQLLRLLLSAPKQQTLLDSSTVATALKVVGQTSTLRPYLGCHNIRVCVLRGEGGGGGGVDVYQRLPASRIYDV